MSISGRTPLSVLLGLALVSLLALPAAAVDSDGDGLRDGFESRYGVTDPHKRDSDGDGVVDSAEDNDRDKLSNLGEQRFGTNPGKRDSDRDGIPDGREDKDRDGRSNAREQDQRPLPSGLRPRPSAAGGDVSPHMDDCLTGHGSAGITLCHFGPASSRVEVVLLGDSRAMMILAPIKKVAVENGWRLTTLIKKACPPVFGIHNRAQRWIDDGVSCRKWQHNTIDWLNEQPPDHIILAHADSYRLSTFAGKLIAPRDRPKAWRKGMKRTLAAMPTSSDVILLADVPRNAESPALCLRKHPRNISRCVTPREPLADRHIEKALHQAADLEGAKFKTIYGKVCSYDPCPVIQGDILMWRDRGHFTLTFARQLTPAFRKLLNNAIPGPASRRR